YLAVSSCAWRATTRIRCCTYSAGRSAAVAGIGAGRAKERGIRIAHQASWNRSDEGRETSFVLEPGAERAPGKLGLDLRRYSSRDQHAAERTVRERDIPCYGAVD